MAFADSLRVFINRPFDRAYKPRFNMPFEAGMAYALHADGQGARRHQLLVLDAKAWQVSVAGILSPIFSTSWLAGFGRTSSCVPVQRRHIGQQPAAHLPWFHLDWALQRAEVTRL